MAILSSLPTMKLMLLRSFTPSTVLLTSVTKKAILARLALGLEADPRVAAVRGGQLLDGDLVEELAARGGLTGLGFVRREAGDEGLQLLYLLLGLLVLIAV